MAKPVPPELRPGIKLMHEPCTQQRRLEGCTAPPGHYCPAQRGMRCIWGPGRDPERRP